MMKLKLIVVQVQCASARTHMRVAGRAARGRAAGGRRRRVGGGGGRGRCARRRPCAPSLAFTPPSVLHYSQRELTFEHP